MNKITSRIVGSLSESTGRAVLSIYMPTHNSPTSPNMSEDQTRYKNLIHAGFEQYRDYASGHIALIAQQELEQKIQDIGFWQNMTRGLAIFVDGDTYQLYHLPIEVPEQIYVGDMFDILPLLQIEEYNQPFYVLALAMHEPKMYKGDLYGLEPLAIDFPKSPEAALNIDEMFAHSRTIRAGGGSLTMNPHGQGDSREAGTEERMIYLRMIDHLIMESAKIDKKLPVLLAATDNEAGDFRSISKLPHLLAGCIAGNRTKEELRTLHELALEIIRSEVLVQKWGDTAEHYENSVGAKKATHDFDSIDQAAEEGRVETLLVSMLDQSHDSIREGKDAMTTVSHFNDTWRQRMLSLIKNVIKNGGNIQVFNRMYMPDKVLVAAVYRY